jgi:glycosyltransferase involved in cell wall biosynthesis
VGTPGRLRDEADLSRPRARLVEARGRGDETGFARAPANDCLPAGPPQIPGLEIAAAACSSEADRLRAELAQMARDLAARELDLESIAASTSWRITEPARRLATRTPGLGRFVRRVLNLNWPVSASEQGARTTPARPDTASPPREGRKRTNARAAVPCTCRAGFSARADGGRGNGRASAENVAAALRDSELFDADGYANRVGNLGEMDPALHYVIVGEQLGWAPSDRFDPVYYRERYEDVTQAGGNLLAHYLSNGRGEGRRPRCIAAGLKFDRSRINPRRRTVLLVTHESSRTGAPILAYNIAKRLGRRHNVVVVALAGGELIDAFDAIGATTVGPLNRADWHPAEMKHLVTRLLATYRPAYAVVNSIASWMVVPALAHAFLPVVLLVHEFASYTRPKSTMRQALDSATEVVFSADIVARSARGEHPSLARRTVHIMPQGECELPPIACAKATSRDLEHLRLTFRPPGMEDAFVVLGCGTVQLRKGVELFIACAAATSAKRPKRPVRFIWIGHGFDPERDVNYSCYLADQIARSRVDDRVAIIEPIADLEPAYAMADAFLLSSRLDPLPNVTIDAALRGLPVICFAGASGTAEFLNHDESTRDCVVPHLDVRAAAAAIVEMAGDETKRLRLGRAVQKRARAVFDMDRYVNRIDGLGNRSVQAMRQRAKDFATLDRDETFDIGVFLPPNAPRMTRHEAITEFLTRWSTLGITPASHHFVRRPCVGFHPLIYAREHAGTYDTATINPLAHFVRSGKPAGPWVHQVITPDARSPARNRPLRAALHVHFYYPELAPDFTRRLAVNRSPCDLLLSTDTDAKASALRHATLGYERGKVVIRVVPNRGRDLGPFLTEYAEAIAGNYDLVGHMHSKRSLGVDAAVGETWRKFLWHNLLGDGHPMMDLVIGRLADDDKIGIVFPNDPHLSDWDDNRDLAEILAKRLGINDPLPPFFEFPIGTMFWARPQALSPLFGLKLRWDDYPEEPLPYDGTILHALERLLPFVARHAGYRFATTHVAGVTW